MLGSTFRYKNADILR